MNKLVNRIVKVANMLDDINYIEDAEMLTRIAELLAGKQDDIPADDDKDDSNDDYDE
jgi:hypothetical protein